MARATKDLKASAAGKPTKVKKAKPSTKGKGGGGGGGSRDTVKTPVILVLAQFKNVGQEKPSRKQVSQLTGYPEKSLSTTLLNLKKNHGHVEYDKDAVWLTDKGRQAAVDKYGDEVHKALDTSSTHDKLIAMHKLTGAKLKIFQFLTDGKAKTYEEIMKHIECTNLKSFGTYTSSLNSANLTEIITEESVKKLRLVESSCFPFGRP